MRDLVLELSIQLERCLSQLCDEKACVTPEHVEVRELIDRAKQALKSVTVVTSMHIEPTPPTRVVYLTPPPGARGT